MSQLMLVLDGKGTLQQQICTALRGAITSGSLRAQTRLAPSRVFALEHGVSRNTVIAAYDQLCAEGYLQSRPGAGTYVATLAQQQTNVSIGAQSEPKNEPKNEPRWSSAVERILTRVPEPLLMRSPRKNVRYNFLYGEPNYSDLPLDRWARLIGKSARELTEKQLDYGPVAGREVLREALAEYLGRSRGVSCDAGQIFIVQGTQDAIDLTVRAFVDEADKAVIEEPHYRGFVKCLRSAGADLHSIPVDEDGLLCHELEAIPDAKMALVTPSHQFPYGSVLSLARRQELLAWAKKNQTVVLEDDYDGEFRYEGRPIPSLQSLDESGLVIYVGTASKMLFPALKLAWMVVPKHMVTTFEKLRSLTDSSGTVLEQLAFAKFISEGHLERHIHKVRRAHQVRRQVLLDTLEQELGDGIEVIGTQAGIHILLRLPDVSAKEIEQIVDQAAEVNVGVYSAQLYYSQPPEQAELLMGYATLTPQQIRTGVKRLAKVIRRFC